MCFFWPHRAACVSLVPQPGIELGPWQGKRGVLAMGPLGNSISVFLFFLNLHACEGRRLNKALTKAAPGVSTVNTRRRQDGHSYQANAALSRQLVGMPAWSGCRVLEAGFRRRRQQEEALPRVPQWLPTPRPERPVPWDSSGGSRKERRPLPSLPSAACALSPQAARQKSESAVHVYIYLLVFGFPFHLGRHRALRRVPCAVPEVLISYLFYA